MRLILTPNAQGHLVLAAETEAPSVPSDLPVDLSFLDETFPHGQRRRTWREMLGGSINGGREKLLKWAVRMQGSRTQSGEYVAHQTGLRAQFILACRDLNNY